MLSFVKSIIVAAGLCQLAYAADGAVTLYRDRDCKGKEMWTGSVGKESRVNGGDLHEALSFSYSGYFRLNIWDGDNFGSSKQCSYCSDYHEDHHEGGCVNIETGFGPNYVFLNKYENDPSDTPCRNFLLRCPFPFPYNGLEAQ